MSKAHMPASAGEQNRRMGYPRGCSHDENDGYNFLIHIIQDRSCNKQLSGQGCRPVPVFPMNQSLFLLDALVNG
jgi:hypothetical protein